MSDIKEVEMCSECPFVDDGNGGEFGYMCNLSNMIPDNVYLCGGVADFCPLKKGEITVKLKEKQK